jgi:hypothetical protein
MLDNLDAGGDVTLWDGCDDEPQALYDDLDNSETDWEIVAQGADGRRTLYIKRMGAAAKLEFGIDRD